MKFQENIQCILKLKDYLLPIWQPVLRIHDILVRIRIRGYLWLTYPDSDPDPAIFVSDLQDGEKVF